MKKKIPIPTNEPKNHYVRFYYEVALRGPQLVGLLQATNVVSGRWISLRPGLAIGFIS